MRAAFLSFVVLAAVGPSRQGCQASRDGSAIPAPVDAACQGLACGDPCAFCPPGTPTESCPVPTVAATACDAVGACVTEGTFVCSQDGTCQGKGCGAGCVIDPPCMADGCMEPSVLGRCDGAGLCRPVEEVVCVDPCAGKGCGEPCRTCNMDGSACTQMMMGMEVCDPNGRCVPDNGARCP
jgi:hypothetical protein